VLELRRQFGGFLLPAAAQVLDAITPTDAPGFFRHCGYAVAPSHLNRDSTADAPNRVWVTDQTYVPPAKPSIG